MGDLLGHITGLVTVILLFGGIPAMVVLLYYFARKSEHAEKMALIEKGIDLSSYFKKESSSYSALMWGSLILGIGLGSFLGYIISPIASAGREYMMPSLSLVFGGLGLIGFFIYRKKTEAKTAG